MRDPFGPPPARKHPDTVFLLSLCLLAGIGQLITGDQPASVTETVAPWVGTMWGAFLTMGAITSVAGVFWRGTVRDGQMIELIGRMMFAPPALAYGLLIAATTSGTIGWAAAAPYLGFAASSLWRVGQIVRELGGIRHVLRVMDDAAEHKDQP